MPMSAQYPDREIPFVYYNGWVDHNVEEQILEYMADERLPADTLFRLASAPEGPARMRELIEHIDEPDALSNTTYRVVFGDLPNVLRDLGVEFNYRYYGQLKEMYYSYFHLAEVIGERRSDDGITSKVPDRLPYMDPEEYEESICRGLALPLWRALVHRVRPEWLDNPQRYGWRRFSMFGGSYEVSDRTMRRRIVTVSVMRDAVVLELLEEAQTVGIKGVGPKGKEDLRRLLSEEHPELQ